MYMKGYTPPASARSVGGSGKNRREESFICQKPVTKKGGTQHEISFGRKEDGRILKALSHLFLGGKGCSSGHQALPVTPSHAF